MLSLSDRAICARDPAIPGLSVILDAQEMAAALEIASLVPTYLRYKPGVSCAVAFRDPLAGPLAAFAYPTGRYAEARQRPEWLRDPAVRFLDALCIVVMPAQLDRRLRAIRRFLDPVRADKHLARVMGGHDPAGTADVQILRYKPGRRLVARIDRGGTPRALLKVVDKANFDSALTGAIGGAAHGAASLLGADSSLRAFATEWVAGRSLCPQALSRAPDTGDVAAAGAALARLHADPFRPAAQVRPADDVRTLSAQAADLAALDAGLARRARQIGDALAARLGTAAGAATLVHGDFSADQVVTGQDGPVIIDWDQAACGDPARDIGSFLARLDAQVADGLLTPDEAGELGAALVDGYGRAAATVPQGIGLHHARSLLLLASEGFRQRHPDWIERGAALIDRAEAVLAHPPRRARDAHMPTLDAALDACHALPAIALALGDAAPVDLRISRPELLRHKPGRRALIRYRLQGDPERMLLGKIRAKGADRRTPQVHHALRAAGLDGGAVHGVGVPRAVGRIDAMNMWLQEEVAGLSLARHLDAGDPASHAFFHAGAALARLHDVPPVTDRRWTLDDEVGVLDRALCRAAQDLPASGTALQAIRAGARAHLDRLGVAETCTLHRDFYFDQVHVDGARIWLLDLDLCAGGDPAIDLGNFLAHLDEYGLRRWGDPAACAAQAAAFLDGYAGARPLADAHRIAVLRAVSLARHIHISQRFPERRHTTRHLLALALRALTDAESMAS